MPLTRNRKFVLSAIHARLPAWVGPVVVAGFCGMATLAVAIVDPHTPGRWPTCPSLMFTGFYCPGCGSLRAANALTRLDLAGAWAMNPMVFFAIPLVVVLWVGWLRRTLTGRARKVAPPIFLWLTLALIICYAILRNIPFFAPWLAPGA